MSDSSTDRLRLRLKFGDREFEAVGPASTVIQESRVFLAATGRSFPEAVLFPKEPPVVEPSALATQPAPQPSGPPPGWVSQKEAARALGYHPSEVSRTAAEFGMKVLSHGTYRLVSEEEVLLLIEARKIVQRRTGQRKPLKLLVKAEYDRLRWSTSASSSSGSSSPGAAPRTSPPSSVRHAGAESL